MSQFLTAIIPTFNRVASLRRLVPWLKGQAIDAKLSEIIIVNDGSSDGTQAYLDSIRDHWIRVIHQSNQGPAKARAAGVEIALGDILLFLDDDMEPASRTFLDAHLAFHHFTNLPTVALGAILPPANGQRRPAFEHFYERSIERLYDGFRQHQLTPSGAHFFSANVSLPKNLYLRSGGFSLAYRHAEDRELGLRLEYDCEAQFAFVESAATYHHSGTRRFAAFIERAYHYGRYDLKIAHSYPEHDELSPYQIFAKPPLSKMIISKAAWTMPGLISLFNIPLVGLARLLHRLGLLSLALRLCSTLYCINYVLGLKDEHNYDI